MAEPYAVTLSVTGESVLAVQLQREDGGEIQILAIFLFEDLAEEYAAWLREVKPAPEGCEITVELVAVHPDELERWIRE